MELTDGSCDPFQLNAALRAFAASGVRGPCVKCPNKGKIHSVTEETESDSDGTEWINTIGDEPSKEVRCRMILKERNQAVTFQVDTGATVNLLPLRYATHSEIVTTVKKLKMWNGTEIHPVGLCRVIVQNPKNRKRYSVEFVVVEENFTPLLGLKAAQGMKLVTG